MSAVNMNLSEFESLVLKEKKPAVIDLWAPWCVYCRRLGPAFEQVAEAYPDVLFVKINIDEVPEVAEKYGVEVIPTLLAFRDGRLAGTVVNPGSKGKIEEFFRENLG